MQHPAKSAQTVVEGNSPTPVSRPATWPCKLKPHSGICARWNCKRAHALVIFAQGLLCGPGHLFCSGTGGRVVGCVTLASRAAACLRAYVGRVCYQRFVVFVWLRRPSRPCARSFVPVEVAPDTARDLHGRKIPREPIPSLKCTSSARPCDAFLGVRAGPRLSAAHLCLTRRLLSVCCRLPLSICAARSSPTSPRRCSSWPLRVLIRSIAVPVWARSYFAEPR
ncbi:hypothetical protein ES703_52668 [subsurface metagenome]